MLEGLAARIRRLGRRFLTPGESFSRRVMQAGFWAFALRIAERLLGLARTVVLARLLAPKDFGLFGLAMLAFSALETFSQTGLEAALIHKKDDVRSYLNTAWTVQIIRGLALAGILAAGAPFVAGFFGEPKAAMLLRVLALGELAKGFTNTGVVVFRKELEFHKQFIYMLFGTLADFAVAIIAALLLQDALALAYGLLAGNAMRMLLSFLVCPYHPKPHLDVNKIRDLHGFGKWIFASSILVFLLNHGDDVLVGKLLGATALGLYQMAYAISNLPATEITHVVSQVMFPAYSKLQDQLPKLRKAYSQTLQFIALVSFPIAGGIAFLAPGLTRLFVGKQWMPMVSALQILAVWGLSRSIAATTGSLFSGLGRPRISTCLQLIKLLLIAAFIYPCTLRWGVTGTALAILVSAFVVDPICIYIAAKTVHSRLWAVVKILLIPTIGSLAMLLAMATLSMLTAGSTTLGAILGYTVLGCVVYLLTVTALDKELIRQILRLIQAAS